MIETDLIALVDVVGWLSLHLGIQQLPHLINPPSLRSLVQLPHPGQNTPHTTAPPCCPSRAHRHGGRCVERVGGARSQGERHGEPRFRTQRSECGDFSLQQEGALAAVVRV